MEEVERGKWRSKKGRQPASLQQNTKTHDTVNIVSNVSSWRVILKGTKKRMASITRNLFLRLLSSRREESRQERERKM